MASPKDRPTVKLSPDQSRAAIPRLRKRFAELEAFDPDGRTRAGDPEAQGLVDRYDATLADIFGTDSADYARYRVTHCSPALMNGPRPDSADVANSG